MGSPEFMADQSTSGHARGHGVVAVPANGNRLPNEATSNTIRFLSPEAIR
jgi:hypothetical protein